VRRLVRTALPERVRGYLAKKQREVDSGKSPEVVWKRARSTQTMGCVVDELRQMVGARGRCMFCEDSRGVDIDHFWPKARYPERTFLWENLLLICSGCNRKKGERFELDANGSPLLIDPTRDDPWDHLYYDSETGIVTACFIPATGEPDPRAQYTVERSNLPVNIQPVTEGRLRTQRNLIRCVGRFLEVSNPPGGRRALEQELRECLDDNSDYGLSTWFFSRDGQNEPPFSKLRHAAGDVWDRLADHVGVHGFV